jgi:hypothetical protein
LDDAWFIEDLGLDSVSIIEPRVVGHELRGGRRRAATRVARPDPPHSGKRGCGDRLHLPLRGKHTLPRSTRGLGGQDCHQTISQLDRQEAREHQFIAHGRSTQGGRRLALSRGAAVLVLEE